MEDSKRLVSLINYLPLQGLTKVGPHFREAPPAPRPCCNPAMTLSEQSFLKFPQGPVNTETFQRSNSLLVIKLDCSHGSPICSLYNPLRHLTAIPIFTPPPPQSTSKTLKQVLPHQITPDPGCKPDTPTLVVRTANMYVAQEKLAFYASPSHASTASSATAIGCWWTGLCSAQC